REWARRWNRIRPGPRVRCWEAAEAYPQLERSRKPVRRGLGPGPGDERVSSDDAYVADSEGNLTCLSLTTGKPLCRFKGAYGSSRALEFCRFGPLPSSQDSSPGVLASVALDRHLRVHNTPSSAAAAKERAPLHKVYLKQRLSCLAFDAETEADQGTQDAETEDEDDDVWKGLKVVEGAEDDEGPGRQKKVTRKRKAGDGVRDKARKKATLP
ncbi:MAG: hypothetical protein BJ554DRAFT_1398, partial [Olpidium bornovanus]